MRITSVSIAGLFGSFNHRIPLFSREPITIVYGPNGVGKTSILRLIYGALKPHYDYLRRTPFDELELAFSDGAALKVTARVERGNAESVNTRPRASFRHGEQLARRSSTVALE